MTKPADHVAIAYWTPASGVTARVFPCVYRRVGVWAVARSGDRRRPWQVIHAPGGAVLHSYASKREAVAVCKVCGAAFRMWAFDAGFAATPPVPAKLERLSGRRMEMVG